MLSKSYFTAAIFGYFLTESSISVSSSQVTTTITNVRRLPSSVRNSFVVPSITGVSPSDYEVSVESISLTDVDTGIEDIKAVHNGRPFDVIAHLNWEEEIFDVNSTNTLFYELSIQGKVENIGSINLNAVSDVYVRYVIYYDVSRLLLLISAHSTFLYDMLSLYCVLSLWYCRFSILSSISIQNRALPTQINAGQSTIDKSGKYNIQVRIKLDTLTQGNSRDYESFAAGASFVPLIIVILFAATTNMVSIVYLLSCDSYLLTSYAFNLIFLFM